MPTEYIAVTGVLLDTSLTGVEKLFSMKIMTEAKTCFLRSALLLYFGLILAVGVFGSPVAEPASRTVTVIGEGTVEAVPDVATVRIGVESYDTDIQKALAESRSKITAIFNALLALGIAEKDMQTANYSFSFDRSASPELGALRSPGGAKPVYRVNNTLSVTIRDLNLTGQIIDAAVLAGANEMWGVQFSLQESGPILSEATELAVSAARERAEYLASLNGLSLGKLLSINESSAVPSLSLMERGLGGGMHPGVTAYTVRLTAAYELAE